MTDYQTVSVRNLSEKQFADSFNNQRFVIPPGGFSIVPLAAACVWFGEGPFFVKDPVTSRDRQAEYERVRARYGCGLGSEREGEWEFVRPRVEVMNHDGTQWVLVIDDPSTDNLPDSVVNSNPDLHVQVEALQAQLSRMQQQLAGTVRQPDVPEDNPPPRGQRQLGRKPKVTVPAEVERMLDEPSESEQEFAEGG